MKNKITTTLLVIALLAGLSLLLYPSVSDYWNSLHTSRAVASYDEEVRRMDSGRYDALLASAHDYNRALFARGSLFSLTDAQREDYAAQLCIDDSGIMGYIEIPTIKLSLPIYHGTGDDVLQVAVGHLEWSSLPVGGESTHCVLSGHRGLPSAKLFTNLDQLAEGDLFVIRTLDEVLTYEVDRILIVEPGEVRALAETLKGYALRDALTPLASGATDASGSLRFPEASATLPAGLYLVVGRPFSDAQHIYTAEPFLVSLPSPDVSGIWRYEVNASPKHTRDDLAPDGGTVVRRVLKRWDDSGDAAQRPDRLTMYLFGSGRLYDTVALSAANSWRWHWDSLPEYDESGLPIDWQVVEEPVPGYTVSVTREGVTFVVTNTPSSVPDSPDAPELSLPDAPSAPDAPDDGGAQDGGGSSRLPQTGLLWWPVPVLTLLGLLCLFLGALSRRRERGDA